MSAHPPSAATGVETPPAVRVPAAGPAGTPLEAHLGLRFPTGFGWGAATSAYQIEGAAKEDGRGESVWDTFCRIPGRVYGDDNGDVAADHYHRYRDDVALMKDLGLRSYRFSIAWPRVMPDGTGRINQAGLDFYKRLVEALHEAGIEPMATLFHWDLPQALEDKGGWVERDTAKWFAEYAAVVYAALDGDVRTWLTINEPKTVVQNGYQEGHHAPGIPNSPHAFAVAHHLALAHGLGVRALRDTGSTSRIGPALNLHPTYPAEDSDVARAHALLQDGYENRLYLDPIFRGSYPGDVLADQGENSALVQAIRDGDLSTIAEPVDLLAVQYYCPYYFNNAGEKVTRWASNQASWQQIYPEGLYDMLTRLRRDYGDLPITITENGTPIADVVGPDGAVNDPARVEFLREHLAAAHRAIGEGVNLESFHVWSLLDNFEWNEGYNQRWGIVYVDYATQLRIPKRSAHWYRGVIASNEI